MGYLQLDDLPNNQIDPRSKEVSKINHIKVYPNPVADILSVEVEEVDSQYSFYLYNMHGADIIDLKISERIVYIPLYNTPNGIYFYVVEKNGINLNSGKILKLHE